MRHPDHYYRYFSHKYVDMLLVYGTANNFTYIAHEEYLRKFPNQKLPDKDVFSSLYAWVASTGSVFTTTSEQGVSSMKDAKRVRLEE